MDHITDIARIDRFREKHPAVEISYGGDGEILNVWRNADAAGKIICPVRNYGRCEKHADPFADIDLDKIVKYTPVVCKCVSGEDGKTARYDALSEIQFKSADVTSALRIDVYVDDTKFCENVIADGVICSTPFGATGYFSSIARTLFIHGLGFAFIAPTLGGNNLVLPPGHKIEIGLIRPAKVVIAADKEVHNAFLTSEDRIYFYVDPYQSVGFAGLDVFHCPKCRARRHGTTLVTQYFK